MLVDLLTCLGVPSSLVPASPLFFLVQVVIAVYVIRYISTYFQEEYTNVPEFKVETPKKEGGRYKPEMQQQNKDVIVCYNPATLELLGKAPVMSTAQVETAVRKARDAQKQWKNTSFAERRRVMRALVQFTVKNQQQMAEVSRDETGKTVFEGMMGEVYTTCGKVDWLISSSEKILSPESRPSGLMMAHKSATVYYEPFGIIGIIIPWNFPVHNALSHISTALMAGNGCVVKVSEWASWSSIYLQRLVTAWLKSCGHNPDLVQFVTGYGETGSAVVSLSDKVLFIGSPEIGKRVMENASKTLTPVILELGGKDPYIVCEDADMPHAINMAVRGSFFNCGQNCVSAERYYIFDKVYDQFVAGVLKQANQLNQGYDKDGSRCDVGSINLPGQFEKYEALVKDAVAKGAQIKLGGKIRANATGHFWEPTILTNVNHTMRIMKEEIFGPIMCIVKVKSDEELLKLANDCDFGLGCSVFSSDYKRAHKIAKAVESGMCSVNDWGLFYAVISSPFGGFKKSGFGKFNGPEGLKEFSVQKTLVTDRFPFLVKPPAFMNYPVAKNAHLITEDMVKIIYENGIMNKVKASVSIVQRLLNK